MEMMLRRSFVPYFLCFGLLILFPGVPGAQEGMFDAANGRLLPSEEGSYEWVNDFFTGEDPVYLEIRADFERLMADQTPDPEYQPASITLQPNDQYFMKMKVRVRPRGYSRRMACLLPPLRVDFSYSGTALKEPTQLEEVKIVAICRRGDVYQQYVLREYLVYKLYNMLTPLSFRVRLAKARYIESRNDSLIYEGWAFLVEDVDKLAKRNQGTEFEDDQLSPRDLNSRCMTRLAMFQFMIINLDWTVTGLHNLKIINRGGELFPVPYDFDYSEMVGALYASGESDPILPELPSRRVYQGYCCSRAELDAVLDQFQAQRSRMFEESASFSYLPASVRKEITTLLQSFFKIIDNPAQVETYFVNNCRD